MFKIELHSHCRMGSCDARVDEKQLVQLFIKNGYDGFVLSNHYDKTQLMKYSYPNYQDIGCSDYLNDFDECPFKKMDENDFTEEQLRRNYFMWLGSLKLASIIADRSGIKFFAGMEYTLDDGKTHIGILGLSIQDFEEEVLYPQRDINYLNDYVRRRGGILIQNHPFRRNPEIHTLVDGYECVNTKHDLEDVFSESEFNRKTGRLGIFTCGSDIHSEREVDRSYTLLKEEPANEKELAMLLRNGEYYNYIARNFSDLSEGYRLCLV